MPWIFYEPPREKSKKPTYHPESFGVVTTNKPLNLSIVLPVLNEEDKLAGSVSFVRLEALAFLKPGEFEIVIADNGSTDQTNQIGMALADRWEEVRYLRINQRGRGGALKHAWTTSDSEVLAYMDVDLSTNLGHLVTMYKAIASGRCDIAFGTRLHFQSVTERCLRREFFSRSYNLLLRSSLGVRFSDAQCGFKAINRDVAHRLLPVVENDNWFFDTELLVLAERMGCRLCEIPVNWREGAGSHVDIVRTAWEDIMGIVRLRRHLKNDSFIRRNGHTNEHPRTFI